MAMPGGQPVPGPLIGRRSELELLASTLATTPAVVIVEGEAGIGKTRLVAELRSYPTLTGQRFVAGSARPVREPFPLGPVLEAVRRLEPELAADRLSPVVGCLRPLLPELSARLPKPPEPLGNPAAERHRVFRALVEVLQAAGPLALVLEDLHWADEHTVDFLRYLLGDLPAGLSVILTYRAEEVTPAVRGLGGALPAAVARAQILLSPLDAGQVGKLAAAILGTNRVAEDFAGYLCQLTGGLPFAVEQVMALLRERGVVALRGHRWRRTLADLAVPSGVRDHVLERARGLPEQVRSLLDAVAVLPHPATEELISAVSRCSPTEVTAGLSKAVETGLLVDDGATVGFRHALAAQAVYHGIPGPQRRELHNRAAEALADSGASQLGHIAYHLRHAGRMAEWATVAERAADQAIALGNHDQAARLLEEVLEHGVPDPATAGALAAKLGWTALECLADTRAAELIAQVLTRDLPPRLRGELRLVRAVVLDEAGPDESTMTEIRRLLRRAADDLVDDPFLRTRAMVALVQRSSPRASLSRRRWWLDRALAEVESVADTERQIVLLGKISGTLAELGDPRWSQLAARIEELTGGEPRQRGHASAYYSIGAGAGYAGYHAEGARLLAAAAKGAIACDDQRRASVIAAAAAVCDYSLGDWDGLASTATQIIEQLADQPRCRALAESVAGSLALARGDLDEAQRWLQPLINRANQQDCSLSFTIATTSLLRLALTRDDPPTVADVIDSYLAAESAHPTWPVKFRVLPWLVAALTTLDRSAEAINLVSICSQGLHGTAAPLAPPALRLARGFLDLARRPGNAADHFAAAAERYDRINCPYDAALAWEAAAEAQLQADGPDPAPTRRATAAGWLHSAVTTYQRLGADWDLSRAARLARWHGIPVPGRHRRGRNGYGGDLTPREREVADLVATGLTNKEIAEQLFVSAETVKKHLQAVMRKLSVKTRAGLARQLGPR